MLEKVYHYFLDTIQTVLLAASIFLVIYIFLFRPFQVSGQSMDPTFKDKEYILTNLIGLRFTPPQRGDVIVFRAPVDREKDYIKRVIGLPGERIMVKDGSVYINDKKLNESGYLPAGLQTPPGSFLHEGQEVTVPEDSYFVMGDNRLNSSDSREWGFLKKSDVIGRSFFVYWPPQYMKIVHNPFH